MTKPCIFEYIWLDSESKFRSKTRVIGDTDNLPPVWNYDGSSTGQASGNDSEITIIPRCKFLNPLLLSECSNICTYMVICDTYNSKGEPLSNNHRAKADKLFSGPENMETPWFGFEQEYFLVDQKTGKPLGFPEHGLPESQGPYYCSGVRNPGRDITDEHLLACVNAGINISGTNAEVAPGQWEFQIGPCEGISLGDHMLAARYLLERIASDHGMDVDWSVKPVKGDWNGSGCHVNFSTRNMRDGTETRTGLDYINEAIERLRGRHLEHMEIYGEGNQDRLTGAHETARWDEFTSGQGDRGASVRIGGETIQNKRGYFEDRRPGSNIDPYLVSAKIFATVMDRDY